MTCLAWMALVALRFGRAEESCTTGTCLPEQGSKLVQSKQVLSRRSADVEEEVSKAQQTSSSDGTEGHKADQERAGFDIYLDSMNPIHVPRVTWPVGFPAELFYSFKAADNKLVVNDTHAFIPYANQMSGIFRRVMRPIDKVEHGVININFMENFNSAMGPRVRVVGAEKLHTIEHNNPWSETGLENAQAELKTRTDADNAFAKSIRPMRTFQVNAYMMQTGVAKDLLYSGWDLHNMHMIQTYAATGSIEALKPGMKAMREGLASKVPEMAQSPRSTSTATNCYHFEPPAQGWVETKDGFYVPLNSMLPSYRAQEVMAPVRRFSVFQGISQMQYDKSSDTLEIYMAASSMSNLVLPGQETEHPPGLYVGHADGSSFPILPPRYMPRVNEPSPMMHYMYKKIEAMPKDYFFLNDDPEELCPPEKIEVLKEALLNYDQLAILKGYYTPKQALESLELFTATLDCASNYIVSPVPQSHSYDFLEATAFLHAMLEVPPNLTFDITGRRDWDDISAVFAHNYGYTGAFVEAAASE